MTSQPTSRDSPFAPDLEVPSVALAIGAHPDDIEFNCGATVAKWTAAGASVHFLILTDGSRGSWDPSVDRSSLVELRRAESRRAACLLGVDPAHVEFLDNEDGELVAGPDARADVCAAIRRVRPDVVLGHDPWKRYRLHPDHRAAGFLTVDGVVAGREPHYREGQVNPAHRPSSLLLFEADEIDHVEDASSGAEAKVAALLAHESQYVSTLGIERVGDTVGIAAFRAWVTDDLAQKGSLAGLAAGEAFTLITGL